MTIVLQRVLMYKRRTWFFFLEVWTNTAWIPNICATYKKNVIADFFSNFFVFLEMIFNDFVEYDGWHDVNMCTLYGMMKQIEKTLFVSFIFFSFFHKSKKCWRSYAYAHVMNHWYVWHAMIFFLNLKMMMHAWMRGCMGGICFFHFLFFLYFNLRAKKTRLRG